jgi:hypothetical protein
MILVCAAVLSAGGMPTSLFALVLDHQVMLDNDRAAPPSSPACAHPAEDIVSWVVADAWICPQAGSKNPMGRQADGYSYGTGDPGWPGDACSMDPHTRCIASASHVYPVVPRGTGNDSPAAGPLTDEAPGSKPIPFSLVAAGLVLVTIAYVRRRKRRALPVIGKSSLPLARDRAAKEPQKKEDKTGSLAA